MLDIKTPLPSKYKNRVNTALPHLVYIRGDDYLIKGECYSALPHADGNHAYIYDHTNKRWIYHDMDDFVPAEHYQDYLKGIE
jgi:hypothetical protein